MEKNLKTIDAKKSEILSENNSWGMRISGFPFNVTDGHFKLLNFVAQPIYNLKEKILLNSYIFFYKFSNIFIYTISSYSAMAKILLFIIFYPLTCFFVFFPLSKIFWNLIEDHFLKIRIFDKTNNIQCWGIEIYFFL